MTQTSSITYPYSTSMALLTADEAKAAVVTWKLTGEFTPGMLVIWGHPVPVGKVVVLENQFPHVVVQDSNGIIFTTYRDSLRPIVLK